MPRTVTPSSLPPLADPIHGVKPRHAVSLRAVLIGLLGTIIICAITPYNDYVLNNTPLIGGSLPLAVVLFFFLFAVFINGPLSRWRPKVALQSQEMATVLVMLLAVSVIPAAGLMQYWPPTVIGSWQHTRERPDQFTEFLTKLNLPDWFWTTFPDNAKTAGERSSDGIVKHFYGKIPDDMPFWTTFFDYLKRWIPPTIGWLVFFVGMFGSILGVSFVVRKQWVENERITFPIAQVQLALIETPSPGRWFNNTFGARSFWVAVGLILALRLLGGLNQYFPKNVPQIDLKYNFQSMFSEPPWSFVQHIQLQTLYPIVVALMFFVSTRVAFSLWATMALWQIPLMVVGTSGGTLKGPYEREVNLGALVAFAGMILWTGRHHYLHTVRLMFGRGARNEPSDPFLSLRTAGWISLGGAILATGWLVKVGMTFGGAALLVAGSLMIWVVMAYVVAHSGFPIAITRADARDWFGDIWRNSEPKTNLQMADVANHFHVQTVRGMWVYARDQLMIYATHGLKVSTEKAPRSGRRLFGAIVLALIIGFFVAEFSSLYCYYKYASTLEAQPKTPINAEVLNGQPQWTMNYTLESVYQKGIAKSSHETWSDWAWAGGSCAFTSFLAFMQLRFTWWPLHPIGVLMVFVFSMKRYWFSILVGWIGKVLLVKFGGAKLFTTAKPFFIGVIVGEVVAAGLFAVSAFVLHLLGVDYKVVQFLPTTQF